MSNRRRYILLLSVPILFLGVWKSTPIGSILGQTASCSHSKVSTSPVQKANLSSLVPITRQNAGQLTEVMSIGRGQINGIALSPDQKHIAVASHAGLWLYSSDDTTHPNLLTGHYGSVTSVAFSPDGSKILSGGEDCTARIWETKTGDELQILEGHTNQVTQVAFSPDGTLVATGSLDQTARLWVVSNGKQLQTLESNAKGIAGGIRSIAFTPDSQWFYYSSSSGGGDYVMQFSIQFWSIAQQKEILNPFGSISLGPNSVFSPDGRKVAMSEQTGNLTIAEFPSGKVIRTYTSKSNDEGISEVHWENGGEALAIILNDTDTHYNSFTSVEILDVASGQDHQLIARRLGATHLLNFDSGHIIVLHSADQQNFVVEDWLIDQISNSEPSTALFTLTEHTSATTSIAFSSDGKQLAFGGDNSTVNIRDIYSGQQKLTLPGHTISVNQVKFSPDGKFIATADQDGQIRLWNATNGELLWSRSAVSLNMAWSVAFNPKSTLLASTGGLGTGSAIKLWDVKTGQEIGTLSTLSASSIVFSPDGLTVAAGTEDINSNVELWNVSNQQHTGSFKSENGWVLGLAYSPDGKLIATASADFTAQLFDALTGKRLAVFGQPQGYNTRADVAFSPDSKILATLNNNILMVWDTSTYSLLTTLSNHTSRIQQVAFSPDGKLVATGSDDNTVRLWGIVAGSAIH